VRAALGYACGIGLGFLAGWALNESAFVGQLIGAGLVLWLGCALAFAVALVVTFAFRRWWR